jgi:Tfp pilus assembly PilM family ATPase
MKVFEENKKSFLDFFPPPEFLSMPAPALTVSDSSVRFIDFKKTKYGFIVKKYGHETLPEGVVSSGQIKDPKTLSTILNNFKKTHKVKHTRSTLPEEKGYVFTAELPADSINDLHSSIEFILEENVPLLVSEVVFDYDVLKTGKRDDGGNIRVSVSVVPIEAVNMYLEAFHKAELHPLHFELESQAVCRSVVPNDTSYPVLVVHLCRSKIGFYVAYGGAVNFSSTVSIEDVPVLTDEILKKVREQKSISNDDTLSLYPAATQIKSEIDKVFLYWESLKDKLSQKGEGIERIIICGSYADVPGIRYFVGKGKIVGEIANVWVNAFSFDYYIPPIPRSQALGYSSVIGLGLPRGK